MEKYNWYFRQKVNPTEMTNAFNAVDDAIKQALLDSFYYGFITLPTVTERNTTPNMSVDLNPPLKAYDENGDWVYIAPGSPINLSFAAVDLPAAGNQKYVSVVVRFARAESDERIDGDGEPVNYRQAMSYELDLVEGAEALVGSAVRPAMPPGDLRVANILLSDNTTAITNSLIDQLDVRRFSLGNPAGVAGKEFELNRELSAGDPEGADTYVLKFNRGEREPFRIRVIEGADPSTNPPKIQVQVFSNTDTFVWRDLLTVGDTTDADVLLSNQAYAGKLAGLETQDEVNDWLDGDNLTDEMINLEAAYMGNLSGMLTQDEVNDFIDGLSLGGGSQLVADEASMLAIDTTLLTDPFLVQIEEGPLYKWQTGSALNDDGYMVRDSPFNGQFVLQSESPHPVLITADDDAPGGVVIIDGGVDTVELTLPQNPALGRPIKAISRSAAGFVIKSRVSQTVRDADTEYGPGEVLIESQDPYAAVELLATDTNQFTITSKNGAVGVYPNSFLWETYDKTAFSTTSTSYIDAQEVQFRTRFSGSRILALVSVDFTGVSSAGRIAITFNDGSQDFVFNNTMTNGGNQGVIFPQMSGVLSPGNHKVTVEIRSESGGAFAGNVQIVCHEVESGRYLGEQSFSAGTLTSGNSANYGAITATFSGTPAILLCGIAKANTVSSSSFGNLGGVNVTQSNTAMGGGGPQRITTNANGVLTTSSILKMVKPGGTAYPSSGDQLALRFTNNGFNTFESISGRTYAIALPDSDVTDFQESTEVAGTVNSTTWVTKSELTVSLSEQSDLYIVGWANHVGATGGRPRARIRVDSVDVTGTVLFQNHFDSNGGCHLAVMVEGLAAGSRQIELQISLSAGGTYEENQEGLMAYRVRDAA